MTDLYRHFDADGNLLYVGISLSAFERFRQHKRTSSWASKAVRMEMERFPSRDEALAAEAVVIRSEKPMFNIAGTAALKFKKGPIIPSDFVWSYWDGECVTLAAEIFDAEDDPLIVSFLDDDEVTIHAESYTYVLINSKVITSLQLLIQRANTFYKRLAASELSHEDCVANYSGLPRSLPPKLTRDHVKPICDVVGCGKFIPMERTQ